MKQCASCRGWQEKLVRVELNIPLIPLHPSSARIELMRKLLRRPPDLESLAEVEKPPKRRRRTRRAVQETLRQMETVSTETGRGRVYRPARRRIPGLGGLVTALGCLAVLAAAICWWAIDRPFGFDWIPLPKTERAAPDPVIATFMECNVRLAEAGTPAERVQVLNQVGDEILRLTRDVRMEASGEDLQALSGMYGKVLRQGLAVTAKEVPGTHRRRVLSPVAEHLTICATDLEGMTKDVAGENVPHIEAMVLSAREVCNQLHDLFLDEAP